MRCLRATICRQDEWWKAHSSVGGGRELSFSRQTTLARDNALQAGRRTLLAASTRKARLTLPVGCDDIEIREIAYILRNDGQRLEQWQNGHLFRQLQQSRRMLIKKWL